MKEKQTEPTHCRVGNATVRPLDQHLSHGELPGEPAASRLSEERFEISENRNEMM